MLSLSVGLLLTLLGCGVASQYEVTLPLVFVPSSQSASRDSGYEFDEFKMVFGPLVFCAADRPGETCDEARLEWRDAKVLDLLATERTHIGLLEGYTGLIRSYMYDLGLTSVMTSSEPRAHAAIEELNGSSVVFRGTFYESEHALPFEFNSPLSRSPELPLGVSLVHSAIGQLGQHDLSVGSKTVELRADALLEVLEGLEPPFEDLCVDDRCELWSLHEDEELLRILSHRLTVFRKLEFSFTEET